MNTKIANFFMEKGFNVTKNYAYGHLNGYETSVVYAPMETIAPVKIHFACSIPANNKKMLDYELRNSKIKFLTFEVTIYGLYIGLNDMTNGSLVKNLPGKLSIIFELLNQANARGLGYCPVCGDEIDLNDSKRYVIDGFEITMNNSCATDINKAIEEEYAEIDSKPNNYVLGFLGALIGGVAGLIVSLIFYSLGFVSAISAFVSILLGAYLYKKFKAKENVVMIVMLAVTTVIFMVLSIFIIYLGAAGAWAVEDGLGIVGIEAFNHYMNDEEFSRYFTSDLLLTLLFTALGTGYQISALAKSIKRRNIR